MFGKRKEEKRLKQQQEQEEKRLQELREKYPVGMIYELSVAGTSHHEGDISKLGDPIKKFTMSDSMLLAKYPKRDIYQYYFDNSNMEVKFVPEPSNPADPNAVRIDINDTAVGYVSKHDLETFNSVIQFPHRAIVASIKGGNSKYPSIVGNMVHFNYEPYVITIQIIITG